ALVLAPPETAARNAVELARRAGSAALAGPAGDLASEAGPSPGPDGSAEGSVAALIAGRP
ncbi:MAG TPA: hypothetical protein VNJ28_03090, partial [Candidatus Limnocylindrales bacterium]|nr:hypothetical protein [Candidatus Limnocylindrales bacterium]